MASMSRTARIVAVSLLIGLGGGIDAGMGGGAVAHAGIDREAVSDLLGRFEFGMTRKQVMRQVRREITARYDEKIFGTSDVYQQDKLRREREQEIERIEKSYVAFDGKIGGWDVSVIDDQFVHKTGESMIVYWEAAGGRKQRRFFFFHDDRLYKMVVTLDAGSIDKSRRDFDIFRAALERQYGPSRAHDRGAAWLGDGLLLIALDKLTHYDTVCLVLANMKMSRKVIELRAEREQKVEKRSPIIRAMIGGDQEVDLSKGSDTIDRILEEK